MTEWDEANKWEVEWHGNCVNSIQEELKQLDYASKMGLNIQTIEQRWPRIDMKDKSVVDIGGGPYSLLLKCINVKGTVIDPGIYPKWVRSRYSEVGIKYIPKMVEYYDTDTIYDEGWIYNCLQHVENPKKVIETARKICKIVRVWEWANSFISAGHIQILRPDDLDRWLGGKGFVGQKFDTGQEYFGMFTGYNKE